MLLDNGGHAPQVSGEEWSFDVPMASNSELEGCGKRRMGPFSLVGREELKLGWTCV